MERRDEARSQHGHDAARQLRPLRVVKVIVHRPRLMICLSMGGAIAIVLVFALGIIFGFVPFEIDYSTGQLNVEGDEIADRHRAVEAARRQSSRYGQAELTLRLLPSPPSAPPLPVYPPASPGAPTLPPPPAFPPPTESTFRYRGIGRVQLYIERRSSSSGGGSSSSSGSGCSGCSLLEEGEVLLGVASLQDAMMAAPAMIGLCKRDGSTQTGPLDATYPDSSNCTGFVGPLSFLRLASPTEVPRYLDVTVPLVASSSSSGGVGGGGGGGNGADPASGDASPPPPSPTPPSASVATTAASSALGLAMLPSGGVNVSALLSTLGSMGGVSIPRTLQSLQGATCTSGAVGQPNTPDVSLDLTSCGPLPRTCCECTSSRSSCVDAPLCESDAQTVRYLTIAGAAGVPTVSAADRSRPASFLAAGRNRSRVMARDFACGHSWLRRRFGALTSLSYRNGSEPLVRFSELLEFGAWQRDGDSADERRKQYQAAQDAWRSLYGSHMQPLVRAFNAGPYGAHATASLWSFDPMGTAVAQELAYGLTDAMCWSVGGLCTGALCTLLQSMPAPSRRIYARTRSHTLAHCSQELHAPLSLPLSLSHAATISLTSNASAAPTVTPPVNVC